MRIIVDENIPQMTVKELRFLGHDVKDIWGTDDAFHSTWKRKGKG